MRPTLKQIAALAGVSPATVSLHLNRHKLAENLAAQTRARIDAAVEKLGYRPSFAARALAKGRTKTLGLVLGGITNPYFATFAESLLAAAELRGYQLLISLSRWDAERERQCLKELIDRQTDGIFHYHPLAPRTAVARRIRDEKFPLLLLNQLPGVWPTVYHDSRDALRSALTHLLGLGHRRVLGIYPPSGPPQLAPDHQAACAECGLEAQMIQAPATTAEARARIVDQLLAERPPALVCCGRQTAEALLGRIERDCPEYRPQIVLYYDIFIRLIEHPQIVGTLYYDSARLVETALDRLLELIETGVSAEPDTGLAVPAEFVPRADFARLLAQEPEPAPRDY